MTNTSHSAEPQSKLTRLRPDIWQRGVLLATRTTGWVYPHKAPLADGTVYACGGGNYYTPEEEENRWINEKKEEEIRRWDEENPPPEEEDGMPEWWNKRRKNADVWEKNIREQRRKERKEEADRQKRMWKDFEEWDRRNLPPDFLQYPNDELLRRRKLYRDSWDEMDRRRNMLLHAVVPEGAMEWLLHEVGHWLAASRGSRNRPNYGMTQTGIEDGRSEWRAWAFEEMVLSPFGYSRLFAPPSQRDGVVFEKNVPIPDHHMRFMERRVGRDRVDIKEWQALYGEWAAWQRKNPAIYE